MERQLRWYQHLAINSYWLGINIASGIITPLMLPYLVVLFMPPEYKNTYLATLRVVGLAVAMLVQPLAGLLSDRSTARMGRRKPFIITGALLNVLFLVLIGLSPSLRRSRWDAFFQPAFGVTAAYAVLLAGVVLLQLSSNLGHGALQGLIPDVVPEDQRGRSSGVKAVLELLPVFLVLFAGPLIDQGRVWLVVVIIMVGFLLTMLATVLFVKEQPRQETPGESLRGPVVRLVALTAVFVAVTRAAIWLVQASAQWVTVQGIASPAQTMIVGVSGLIAMAGAILIGVYFGARIGIGSEAVNRGSFIWWVINRLLFLAAIGSIQGFAQFFLSDVLHIANAATMTTVLLAVVAVFLLPAALLGGMLADRFGRRRMVMLAGLVSAVGATLLIFSTTMPMVIFSGCILGLGTGVFMASNWALGTRLVPPKAAGRYLGISNLAGAGAGIVGAGIGGPMADFFNSRDPGLGYLVLFAIYAGLFFLSALALRNVHE